MQRLSDPIQADFRFFETTGSNRNDSGRRHRSKRKKLLRNEPGQSRPKSAPVSGQPFTRSCACALNGRRNCTNQPGPVCSTGTKFFALQGCFATIFELTYFTIIISKTNLAEGLPCLAATPQIGRVGGATRLFQSVVKNLTGFGRPSDEDLLQFGLAD